MAVGIDEMWAREVVDDVLTHVQSDRQSIPGCMQYETHIPISVSGSGLCVLVFSLNEGCGPIVSMSCSFACQWSVYRLSVTQKRRLPGEGNNESTSDQRTDTHHCFM
jgi:hypothetical protein